jgi:uncharacterized OB-fold protein
MSAPVEEHERILPIVTPENERYWRAARAHALELPFCLGCERAFYPPQRRCPHCLSDRTDWRAISGRGRIYSWIVMHQVYDPSFKDRAPYAVAIIELEEGPRLVTNLVGLANDAIRLDLPVRAVYDDLTDAIALVQFTPEEA